MTTPSSAIVASADYRAQAKKPAIAVLPIRNLSTSADDEYFSDGITEDIIAQLSQVASLKVIARTSVMQYKKTDKTVRTSGVNWASRTSWTEASDAPRIACALSLSSLRSQARRRFGPRRSIVT